MNFNQSLADYLKNSSFSDGLCVKISQRESQIPDRFTLIEEIVTNAKVIHVGCCDHIPLIKQKIRDNLWLHSRMTRITKRCLGIDINHDGISFLKNELRLDDIVCADLIRDDVPEIHSDQWDFMVMGEILEHLDNPALFLQSIYEKYSHRIKRIIITVPNAFAWLNFKGVFTHSECINTDHRYWFTPFTLAKIATSAHYKIDYFHFCEPAPFTRHWSNRIRETVLKNFPAFRETLLMVISI